MFTEFALMALVVCSLLCAGKEDHVGYGLSFDTLLKAYVLLILQGFLKSLEHLKHFKGSVLSLLNQLACQKCMPTLFNWCLTGFKTASQVIY